MRNSRRSLGWTVAAALVACAPPARSPEAAAAAHDPEVTPVERPDPATVRTRDERRAAPPMCRYAAKPAFDAALAVTVDCDPPIARLAALEPLVVPHVSFAGGDAPHAAGVGRWALPDLGGAIRYTIDLGALAQEARHHDFAPRVDGAIVAPLRSFLLVPEPPIYQLALTGPPDLVLAANRANGTVELPAAEVDRTGEFAVVGASSARVTTISEPGTRVTLVALGTTPPFATLEAWLRQALRGAATVLGAPPTPRSLVIVIGLERAGTVLNGSALGASSVVLLGEQASRAALLRDPVLIEEFYHQGLPRVGEEGDWRRARQAHLGGHKQLSPLSREVRTHEYRARF